MINKYIKIYIPVAILFFLFSTTFVFALNALNAGDCNPKTGHLVDAEGKDTVQICYVPLEPNAFPGVTTSSNLNDFLGQVFNFGIAIAVVLALIMIIWGGIMKMTTDSWSKHDEANSRIKNALYGLGLALISWLLLYTLDPCLVDFTGKAGCDRVNTLTTAPPPTVSPVQEEVNGPIIEIGGNLNDSKARSLLTSVGITISSRGNCSDQNKTTCTSLEGLPQSAVLGLQKAQAYCKSYFMNSGCLTITGGTETGHKSHGTGIATVDISYNSNAVQALIKKDGLTESTSYSGRGTFTCEPAGGGAHSVPCGAGAGVIHIQF